MKKINEAQFRSPKWFRKYLDFEVTTGKDVSPEAKDKRKLIEDEEFKKEQQEKESLKKFNNDWGKIISDDYLRPYLRAFLKSKGIFETSFIDIREGLLQKKYYTICDEFSLWFKGEKEREEEERMKRRRKEQAERDAELDKKRQQENIERELNNLYNSIIRDFTTNRYNDKYETKSVKGKITFYYRFENGDKFEMCDNRISYIDSKYQHGYTVGLIWRNKFIRLCNEIISKGGIRGSSGHKGSDSKQKSYSSSTYKETPKTGDPKRDKYNLLKDKIKQREDQLRKMGKNDPDRQGLENELKAYKRVINNMKDEYKFEGLKYLKTFESKLL